MNLKYLNYISFWPFHYRDLYFSCVFDTASELDTPVAENLPRGKESYSTHYFLYDSALGIVISPFVAMNCGYGLGPSCNNYKIDLVPSLSHLLGNI